jgi:serine/threonine protein kinase
MLPIPGSDLITVANSSGVLQEFAVQKNIIHPNIVPIEGAYIQVAIVMPCSESDLDKIVSGGTSPLSESEVAYAIKETLQGLEAMHQQCVVHRDIKPANVMAFADGRIQIGDFGFQTSLTRDKPKLYEYVGTLW